MSKIKGVKQINKILNKFLSEFEATCDIGTDFCYWSAESLINYTVVVTEKHDMYFMNNFNRLAPDIKCDVFLASFLHELGHHETLYTIDDADEAYCRDYKQMLQRRLDWEDLTEEDEKDIYQQYFDLPDEYEATMWAIEYIRNNKEKINELWLKIQKALMNFYIVNKMEVY